MRTLESRRLWKLSLNMATLQGSTEMKEVFRAMTVLPDNMLIKTPAPSC